MADYSNFRKSPKTQTRREQTKWYLFFCVKCKNPILLYQKDEPGSFQRIYVDRIIAPARLRELQLLVGHHQLPDLVCKHCDALIGQTVEVEGERLMYELNLEAIDRRQTKKEHSLVIV